VVSPWVVFHNQNGKTLVGHPKNGGLSKLAAKVWRAAAVAKVPANDLRFECAEGGAPGVRFEVADLRHIAPNRLQGAGLNELSRNLLMRHAAGIAGKYADQEKDSRGVSRQGRRGRRERAGRRPRLERGRCGSGLRRIIEEVVSFISHLAGSHITIRRVRDLGNIKRTRRNRLSGE
jgi:hypothetical protein